MDNITLLIIIGIIFLFIFCWGLWQRAYNKDAIYIKKALREAAQKNSKVGTYMSKWRMWRIWLKIRRIHKLNEEIIGTLRRHPNRFSVADKFFSLYLDSSLQVLGNYHTLVSQPVRNPDVQRSINDSERSLDNIIKGLEGELVLILHTEIQSVETEKEVLGKHSR